MKSIKATNGIGAHEPAFNLLRSFSLLSLVSIALISAASAFLLSRFLTDSILQRDAQVHMEYIESIVQAGNTHSYFVERDRSQSNAALEQFFGNISRMPDVVRANVYGEDRYVIWSSHANLIGTRLGPNHELEKAFSGELEIESGEVGKADKAEHVFFDPEKSGTRFVENYIPMWDSDRARVIGVVELYKLPRALFQLIDEGNRLVWVIAIGSALFLYLGLFWIVRRGSIVIRQQHEQLVESETLAALGAMASAVAHSIRNPLASIRSSADLAIEEDPEHLRECAADIIRETERLDKWVHELLEYSRTEHAEPEPIDINELIQESVRDLMSIMDKQGVKLTVNGSTPLQPIRGYAAPLGQAFHNLLANAIDAMPDGGEITVASRIADDRRYVEVQTSDTGHGIPDHVKANVFRPFVTTKRNGLGLGLALSRRIVEQHGGDIDISSTEGRGTTVTVRIPVAV